MKKYKILCDGFYVSVKPRGMARFVGLLTKDNNNISIKKPKYLHAGAMYPIWEQFIYPIYFLLGRYWWSISPYNTLPLVLVRRTILVIHDLIFLDNLKNCRISISMLQNIGFLYRSANVLLFAKYTKVIITVSLYSKQQIHERLNVPLKKIYVIPNAIDIERYCFLTKQACEDFILIVGGEAPNKNLEQALKGFAFVVKKISVKVHLEIVGVRLPHHAAIKRVAEQLGIKDLVLLHPYLSQDVLDQKYVNACVLFFPSLEEGFGIPLLEAMAAGTPIACSHCSVMPEIVGDAALLFNPWDSEDMADKLLLLLNDKTLRNVLAKKGLDQVKKYSLAGFSAIANQFWHTWEKSV